MKPPAALKAPPAQATTASSGILVNRGQIVPGVATVLLGGDLEAAGGTYSDAFFVNSSTLRVTAAPAIPATIRLVGDNNHLLTDNQPNTVLWLDGNTSFGFRAVVRRSEQRQPRHDPFGLHFNDAFSNQNAYLTILGAR